MEAYAGTIRSRCIFGVTVGPTACSSRETERQDTSRGALNLHDKYRCSLGSWVATLMTKSIEGCTNVWCGGRERFVRFCVSVGKGRGENATVEVSPGLERETKPARGRGAASLLLYPYSAHINFVDMYAKFVTDRRQWDGQNVMGKTSGRDRGARW